jgi:adenosylcobinamide-GDP ribazoletransferase
MRQELTARAGILGKCLHQCRLFFVALQFFTRLPVPSWVGYAPEWLEHASRYLPAVGLVVGGITAGVYAAAALIWPQPVAVLLSTIAGIYLTGAFHEDGFADMCDGFGGGYTRERVLEIMKDSRIGAYGAIGIAMLLALKCTALATLPDAAVAAALLLAHVCSRLVPAAMIWRLQYVKDEGKAKPLARHMSGGEFAIACGFAIVTAACLGYAEWLGWAGIAAGLMVAVVAGLLMARMFLRRLGGYTGDCLGAAQQVSEVAIYLGLLAAVPF